MFTIQDVQLETVCGITSTLPKNAFAEIAFAGKSNGGKSSLLNGLINRKSLARTSAQPGKTRTINYYRVKGFDKVPGVQKTSSDQAAAEPSGQTLTQNAQAERIPLDVYLVDLPGYGYAKAAVEIKEQWGALIERYLRTSRQLKQVFLLVDIRHEPGANDKQMYDWICHNGYEPVIIATKLDKIKKSQVQKQVSLIRKGLGMKPLGVLIPFSAETKQGREEIWQQIMHATNVSEGNDPPDMERTEQTDI